MSVVIHHVMVIIMGIIHQEIHLTIVITTVHRVLHLIFDQFHHELGRHRIVVIVITMTMTLHHLIEQIAVIVVNQLIMAIIHYHLDLTVRRTIMKYINHYHRIN